MDKLAREILAKFLRLSASNQLNAKMMINMADGLEVVEEPIVIEEEAEEVIEEEAEPEPTEEELAEIAKKERIEELKAKLAELEE
jgi:hypothetical protein